MSYREVAEFAVVPGYEGGVVVSAPDEPRYMNYTPTHLQRTDLKDLVRASLTHNTPIV